MNTSVYKDTQNKKQLNQPNKLSKSIVHDINNYISNNITDDYSEAIFIDLKKQQNIKEIFNVENKKICKKKKVNVCFFCRYIIYIICSVMISYSITYMGLEIKHSNFNELNYYMENIGNKLDNIKYLNDNLKTLNKYIGSPDYHDLNIKYEELSDNVKKLSKAVQNFNIDFNLNYKETPYFKDVKPGGINPSSYNNNELLDKYYKKNTPPKNIINMNENNINTNNIFNNVP